MTDPLPGLTGFAAVLRRIGLGADPVRTRAYLEALSHVDVAVPSQVYWAGRLSLCAEPDDIAGYDAAFAAWFGGAPVGTSSNGRARRRTATSASLVAPVSGEGNSDVPQLNVAASDTEILRQRDVTSLDGAASAPEGPAPAGSIPTKPCVSCCDPAANRSACAIAASACGPVGWYC